MYTLRQSLPYQSGLLTVELVAWDDGVVNIGEDLPVVFLLHRESAVKCVVGLSIRGSLNVYGIGIEIDVL
jgi:hypothetical protein